MPSPERETQALAPKDTVHSTLALTAAGASVRNHSRQQKKAKQGIAERCKEFINEEQDHLIQSLLWVPKSTV